MESTLASRAAKLSRPAHPADGTAISLDSGYAYPGVFPDLTRAAQSALRVYGSESLQYGRPFGLQELQQWIASYMREDGVAVDPDDVLIVNGAKNGLDLLCRLFIEEGDAIAVTGPTYFTAIPIFRSFGLTFIEVSQDNEGLRVEELVERLDERAQRGLPPPKFIYDIPDFHNPTGITMSRRRREALVALATARHIPIVEDSPYRRLRFEGTTEPSLKSLDSAGIVFALGTFSKLLAPGLRIGWISGPRAMLERLARLKSDGGTCPLTQRMVFEFLKEGGLNPHLELARAAYAEHRDAMVATLRRLLPGVEFTVPHGGYYLWLKFPPGTDTDALAHHAYDAGVSVIPGSAFFPSDAGSAKVTDEHKQYMRLAYSHATPREIEQGISLLSASYNASAR